MFDPNRLENLVKNSHSSDVLTKFLSIEDQKYLKDKKHVNIYFSHSYPNEERKRAFITKDEHEDIDFNISVIEFKYNTKYYTVTHQDTLGALMSLGITREVIGDIIIGPRNFILVCAEMKKHVMESLTSIGRANVEVIESDIEDLQTLKINNYIDEQIIVSSMRLDVIVSEVAKVSRTKATEIINMKLVKVNGLIKQNCNYFCRFDDIISIRRIGRIIIQEELKKTKKDKIILLIKRTL